jgi:hypothetical protein
LYPKTIDQSMTGRFCVIDDLATLDAIMEK